MAARRTLLVVLGCCLASSVKAEKITEEEGEGRLGWDKHFPGSLSAFLCPGSTQLEVTVPQRWPSTPPRSRTRWSLDSSASCLEPSSSLSSDFPWEVSLARSLPALVTDLNMASRSHPSDQVITPRATNLRTHFQGFSYDMFFFCKQEWVVVTHMPSSLKERDQNLWHPSLKLSGRGRRNTKMRTNSLLLAKPSGGTKYFCFKKNTKYMKNMACEWLYSGFLVTLSVFNCVVAT